MKIFFLCGHKSPYGVAHFLPLLDTRFEIAALVLATDKRWSIFREKLSGKDYYPKKESLIKHLKIATRKSIRTLAPSALIKMLKRNYVRPIDLQKMAKEGCIPVIYEDNVNSGEFVETVRKFNIDLIVSAAYPQIFSKRLLSAPKYGCVNFHPSLLPEFRGAHPHFWTIAKGDKRSGLTAHFMTRKVDRGDIIAQIEFSIENFNYIELYKEINKQTPAIVKKMESFFHEGGPKAIPQEHENASYFTEPREIHKRIFWNIHASMEIVNLVRTGSAYCFFRDQRIIIKKCYESESNRNLTNNIKVENGTIIDLGEDYIAVAANGGVINIVEIYIEQKAVLARNFIRKQMILIGEKYY